MREASRRRLLGDRVEHHGAGRKSSPILSPALARIRS
jgi:hypothetical protein